VLPIAFIIVVVIIIKKYLDARDRDYDGVDLKVSYFITTNYVAIPQIVTSLRPLGKAEQF
jgi:hypothetical protein